MLISTAPSAPAWVPFLQTGHALLAKREPCMRKAAPVEASLQHAALMKLVDCLTIARHGCKEGV